MSTNQPSYPAGADASRKYKQANVSWESLSDKEAKTLDQFELGKVKQVAEEYIFTEKGHIQKEKFFVPRRFADRFDGKTLWFSITKMQAENEFRREIPPAPGEFASRYTTVEKKITERTVETLPSGERREHIDERTA
jgi:hypothetical protein